jgi:hypothetical protein
MQSPINLRKVSETVYEQTKLPEGQTKPHKWIMGMHQVRFHIKDISLNFCSNIHDVQIDLEKTIQGGNSDNPKKLVEPNIRQNEEIRGILDNDTMEDMIWIVREPKDNGELPSFSLPPSPIKVTLTSGEPMHDNEYFTEGTYNGACGLIDADDSETFEEYMYFELTLPPEQLSQMTAILKIDPNASIEIGVHITSFMSEVEDWLAPVYAPQYLFINKHAPAFISDICVSHKLSITAPLPGCYVFPSVGRSRRTYPNVRQDRSRKLPS